MIVCTYPLFGVSLGTLFVLMLVCVPVVCCLVVVVSVLWIQRDMDSLDAFLSSVGVRHE